MNHTRCARVREAKSQTKLWGFSLVELIVVMLVIGLLASLLLPALEASKEKAKRTMCLNNERQLCAGALLYSHDNSKGQFCPDGLGWPLMDLNWLQQSASISVHIFSCPSTLNMKSPVKKQYKEGPYYYPDLNKAALDRNSGIGYSYDLLPWFQDMENFWNGNWASTRNSPRILKTTTTLNTYAHQHEAFGLKGKLPGPAAIWLLTDNDLLSREPFYPKQSTNHRSPGVNTTFTDGHSEWIKQENYVFRYEISQDNNRTRAYPRPRL